MLTGEGVQAISDRLSLSNATVRTHLRAIFSKTGTHRQAETVGLLSTIVPWLTEDQA
jgi:DNA-binding CsgD family transcriptional regulator